MKFHQRWSCGGKSIYFFVYRCSYRRLGDLSTTLEMTVLSQLFFTRKDDHSRRFFATLWMTGLRLRWHFLGDRHFDQVQRVEKSPKAKQYYTTTLVLSALLSNGFSIWLHLIYPCSLQWIAPFSLLTHTTHNPPLSTASPPSFFYLFSFIYRCYNMLYLKIQLHFNSFITISNTR